MHASSTKIAIASLVINNIFNLLTAGVTSVLYKNFAMYNSLAASIMVID